jgi:hypothetical protein
MAASIGHTAPRLTILGKTASPAAGSPNIYSVPPQTLIPIDQQYLKDVCNWPSGTLHSINRCYSDFTSGCAQQQLL